MGRTSKRLGHHGKESAYDKNRLQRSCVDILGPLCRLGVDGNNRAGHAGQGVGKAAENTGGDGRAFALHRRDKLLSKCHYG